MNVWAEALLDPKNNVRFIWIVAENVKVHCGGRHNSVNTKKRTNKKSIRSISGEIPRLLLANLLKCARFHCRTTGTF